MSGWDKSMSELQLERKREARDILTGSIEAGLMCIGFVRLCTITIGLTLQLLSGRPGHERFYDYRNNLSYCSGPEEIIDSSTRKVYTLTQEIARNPWDNIPYEIRTGKLLLNEEDNSKRKDF